MKDHKILICALQETKLKHSSKPLQFKNYTFIRKDRPAQDGGGGVAFLIHNSVSYTEVNTRQFFLQDNTIEHIGIKVKIDEHDLTLLNLYIPPCTSCPADHEVDLQPLLSADYHTDVIVMGDVNGHHESWFSISNDNRATNRGNKISEAIDSSPLTLLNRDLPTRVPTGQNPSSPDITLISSHISQETCWTPATALNSDHLPILINPFPADTQTNDRNLPLFKNYRKANWKKYRESTEDLFANQPPPSSCSKAYRTFAEILLRADRKFIPKGRRQEILFGLSPEAIDLIKRRDRLRASNPQDPSLPELQREVEQSVVKGARDTWIRKINSCGPHTNSAKYWKLLQEISGKKSHTPPNQPITFGDKTLTKRIQVAEAFCKQFSTPPDTNLLQPSESKSFSRNLKRKIKKISRVPNLQLFTVEMIEEAIKQSGTSTAPGPDGLCILHLKHLGPKGKKYLCQLYNLSLSNTDIPMLWKTAIISAILKAGKEPGLGKSFRPISLLSPAAKVLERLLLPHLTEALVPHESQHGFRKAHSTITALLPLSHQIAVGFNKKPPPKRTIAVAIDLSKAFDCVPPNLLIKRIIGTSLHPNIKRWLAVYLKGRKVHCRYNGAFSKPRTLRAGVPQGSIISPCLFNFYIANYPDSIELHTSYADDITAAASNSSIDSSTQQLTAHLGEVTDWASNLGMSISAPKSQVILFTPHKIEYTRDTAVSMNGSVIPTSRTCKILGVHFDTSFTFNQHVEFLIGRTAKLLNILKALAGSRWGQSKETLIFTFQALIKPIINYAAPVWYPNMTNQSKLQQLQTVQNNALRICTGAHKMASEDHLHQETKILKIRENLDLICMQYLASAMRTDHPSHGIVTADSGPRDKKNTLQSKYSSRIRTYLEPDGTLHPDSYPRVLKRLHTKVVEEALECRSHNRVLGRVPSEINTEEESLPRAHRTTLSQLRSGHCSSLEDYQLRIGNRNSTGVCPECKASQHTVEHIFECPAKPTGLCKEDLWEKPVEVARMLGDLPSFSYLPPLERPPPRPPDTQDA